MLFVSSLLVNRDMMKKLVLLTVLLGTALLSACEKDDIEHKSAFDRSYDAWLKFRESSGNNYRYEVSGATWAGSSWLTAITVRNGKVVQRDFHYEVFNGMRKPDDGWASVPADELLKELGFSAEDFLEYEGSPFHEALQWSEMEGELEFHEQTPAGRVQTLDEVYESARAVWLKKRSDAKISFEAKNDGLISSAGFVPDGCMDDCFSGIVIRSIETIE